MAWTTPKTWAAGETLTAANFNTHIRDNFNAIGPHLIARKTADEPVTSSTTVQNDDHLLLTVAASEVWAFTYRLRFIGDQTGGGRLAWTFPAGGQIEILALTSTGNQREYATSSPSTEISFDFDVTSEIEVVMVEGHYVGAGNAGTLTLQWAQQNSSATATTLKANSCLLGMKLA